MIITHMAETIANMMERTIPTKRSGYFIWSNYAYLAISDSYFEFVLNQDGFIMKRTPMNPPAIVKISGKLTFSLIIK